MVSTTIYANQESHLFELIIDILFALIFLSFGLLFAFFKLLLLFNLEFEQSQLILTIRRCEQFQLLESHELLYCEASTCSLYLVILGLNLFMI